MVGIPDAPRFPGSRHITVKDMSTVVVRADTREESRLGSIAERLERAETLDDVRAVFGAAEPLDLDARRRADVRDALFGCAGRFPDLRDACLAFVADASKCTIDTIDARAELFRGQIVRIIDDLDEPLRDGPGIKPPARIDVEAAREFILASWGEKGFELGADEKVGGILGNMLAHGRWDYHGVLADALEEAGLDWGEYLDREVLHALRSGPEYLLLAARIGTLAASVEQSAPVTEALDRTLREYFEMEGVRPADLVEPTLPEGATSVGCLSALRTLMRAVPRGEFSGWSEDVWDTLHCAVLSTDSAPDKSSYHAEVLGRSVRDILKGTQFALACVLNQQSDVCRMVDGQMSIAENPEALRYASERQLARLVDTVESAKDARGAYHLFGRVPGRTEQERLLDVLPNETLDLVRHREPPRGLRPDLEARWVEQQLSDPERARGFSMIFYRSDRSSSLLRHAANAVGRHDETGELALKLLRTPDGKEHEAALVDVIVARGRAAALLGAIELVEDEARLARIEQKLWRPGTVIESLFSIPSERSIGRVLRRGTDRFMKWISEF